VTFAGNERVTRGIRNVTQDASVSKTVNTNLSKTEEDTRIKKVVIVKKYLLSPGYSMTRMYETVHDRIKAIMNERIAKAPNGFSSIW
jgi:hypothetical protein